tara:strand:- start:642 stop:971 length:330 start_codon:yes stop_codon:yes gene_type:complete
MSFNKYNSSIDKLLYNINENYKNWYGRSDNWHKKNLVLSVKTGRKFDKVISDSSVWGFVAKSDGVHKGISYKLGDVFKPAGWNAPAKHVRGSIFSDSVNWFEWTGPNYL